MRSFKTELNLNNKQKTLCAKHAGVARHAWNWALDVCREAYASKQKRPSAIDLHKKLVAEVKSIHAWYYEVSKCAPHQALRNLDVAYKRFFKKLGGFPKRKKKGRRDSFYLENPNKVGIQIQGKRIKVPVLGWLRTFEKLPTCNPKSCCISCRAGRWFISFRLDSLPQPTPKPHERVGVDLGISTLATLSTGVDFKNPRAFRSNQIKLKNLQRKFNRQAKGSNNRAKTKLKIQRLHFRIANIRANAIHHLTSHLSKNHAAIVIEDLNVRGMLKNRKLAKSIADVGMYEFRRQIEYKCKWYGSELRIVDKFFPSSRLCSSCGNKKETLSLSERVYVCDACGFEINRDFNASVNLRNAVSSTVYACGATVSPSESLAGCCEAGIKRQSTLVDSSRF